mmetsp:Transcript_33219/g.55705  ORF Transcript_33219/g.55705 Transcript_33219/m.55705 type:complete len:223 (-) Transcript_33219:290-958(-)
MHITLLPQVRHLLLESGGDVFVVAGADLAAAQLVRQLVHLLLQLQQRPLLRTAHRMLRRKLLLHLLELRLPLGLDLVHEAAVLLPLLALQGLHLLAHARDRLLLVLPRLDRLLLRVLLDLLKLLLGCVVGRFGRAHGRAFAQPQPLIARHDGLLRVFQLLLRRLQLAVGVLGLTSGPLQRILQLALLRFHLFRQALPLLVSLLRFVAQPLDLLLLFFSAFSV